MTRDSAVTIGLLGLITLIGWGIAAYVLMLAGEPHRDCIAAGDAWVCYASRPGDAEGCMCQPRRTP